MLISWTRKLELNKKVGYHCWLLSSHTPFVLKHACDLSTPTSRSFYAFFPLQHIFPSSCYFSLRLDDRVAAVNPLRSARTAGVSWKAQSQMEGDEFAHRGQHSPRGGEDYYPRCISTTTDINPTLLFLTPTCSLCYWTGRYVALLVLFIEGEFSLYFQEKPITTMICAQIC